MYRFPLESVLSHRDTRAKILQKELAAHEQEVRDEEARLEQMEEGRVECFRNLSHLQEDSLCTVSEVLIYRGFLDRLWEEITHQKKKVVQVRDACTEKRLHTIEAMKDKKVLEKLKGRRLKEYLYVARKAEEKVLDELAITRYEK